MESPVGYECQRRNQRDIANAPSTYGWYWVSLVDLDMSQGVPFVEFTFLKQGTRDYVYDSAVHMINHMGGGDRWTCIIVRWRWWHQFSR